MKALRIVAYGKPISQGSKRHVGRGIMVESSKYAKPWRERVHQAALDALAGNTRLDGPVTVEITFYFDRPRTHYRTGRNAHLLRENAPPYPDSRASGDIDKLQRSCFDSLTSAGIWRDDAQIVAVAASKRFCSPDAGLLVPGVLIDVTGLLPAMVSAAAQPIEVLL